MNEKSGAVFSIAEDNEPVKFCTVSKLVYDSQDFGINYFSMAENTDISAESYIYHKIILQERGELVIYDYPGNTWTLHERECFITPVNIPVRMKTQTGSIYTEIRLREGVMMNQALQDGKIFTLADLVPYQSGRIVNMALLLTLED